MPRRALHRLAVALESHLDAGDANGPPRGKTAIVPYRGFGRDRELFVRGRVVIEKAITRAKEAEPAWRSVLNSYRRFQSDEIAGARVIARYRDAVVETTSDAEGHFQVRLQPAELEAEKLWHEVGLELHDAGIAAIAHAVVPHAETKFGIVSDIDDTIVRTGATSIRTMIKSVVLSNAATRMPFEGVAELYQALHRERNPLFYVSSSPWNLYDLIHDYMTINAIPPGPLFLQDWGIDRDTFIHAAHDTHKLAQIQTILDFYPSMPFVLIGDSGQLDPEIYLQVIRANPGRVLAAFVRDVTLDLRDRAVATLVEEAKTAGVEMLYVADSAEAAGHARRLGLLE
jgi:phosphatidate phosphatase APP1